MSNSQSQAALIFKIRLEVAVSSHLSTAKITDAGIDAVTKSIETDVMLAIQNLFFNKTP
jgi:hypothetical protein